VFLYDTTRWRVVLGSGYKLRNFHFGETLTFAPAWPSFQEPSPLALNPNPQILNPKRSTLKPKPQILSRRTQTLASEASTQNSKSSTPIQNPQILDFKSQTLNPQPLLGREWGLGYGGSEFEKVLHPPTTSYLCLSSQKILY
jgi:hypothetical protein